ncbi:hypothetical protein E2C01_031402 [Portunus trituberculatus]|uniref:Uncharacterized protein n=1 Tax=Portunus trituberculatus TaxID=210409 RepID=A0A5B7EXL0_PORTR|nr:hypothetical protein [Portunus trituberculatus]
MRVQNLKTDCFGVAGGRVVLAAALAAPLFSGILSVCSGQTSHQTNLALYCTSSSTVFFTDSVSNGFSLTQVQRQVWFCSRDNCSAKGMVFRRR